MLPRIACGGRWAGSGHQAFAGSGLAVPRPRAASRIQACAAVNGGRFYAAGTLAGAVALGAAPGRRHLGAPASARRTRRGAAVSAVFEKFSERSIKAVMVSQQQAKAMGAPEVRRRASGARAIAAPRIASRALAMIVSVGGCGRLRFTFQCSSPSAATRPHPPPARSPRSTFCWA